MASAAELAILIGAKDSASAVLKQVSANTSTHTKSMSDAFGKVGQAAKIATAAIAGIAAGIAVTSIKAAAEAQAIAKQTDAVLASTKGVAGVTAKAVDDLALSLSLVTPFEDDLIAKTQNMLLTFTNIGKDVFPMVTETALNMAQALGGDPVQQSVALGKALNDPIKGITALTRVGVTFTDAQKDVIKKLQESGDIMGAQKIILAELGTEFGNSARAAGETFAGKLEIAKNAVGNIQEAIGGPLIDALTGLLKSVTPMLVTFGETIPTIMASLGEVFDVLTGRAPEAGGHLKEALGPDTAATIMNAMATIRETVRTVFTFISENIMPKVNAALDFMRRNWDSVAFALKVLVATVVVPAFTLWAITAGAAALATIVALAPVILILAAVGTAAFLLHEAWTRNLGGIQEKTQAVLDFLESRFGSLPTAIGNAWNAIGPILQLGLSFILAPINAVVSAVETAMALIARFTNTPIPSPSRPAPETFLGTRATPPSLLTPQGGSGFFESLPWTDPRSPFFGIPEFAHGGIVPGSGPQLVMAHGGEEIRRPDQRGGITINFNGPTFGMLDFEQQIKRIVRDNFPAAVAS